MTCHMCKCVHMNAYKFVSVSFQECRLNDQNGSNLFWHLFGNLIECTDFMQPAFHADGFYYYV